MTLTPPVAPSTQHQLRLFCAPADVALWPLGPLYGDVKFSDASAVPVVIPTSTFSFNIIEGLTK